MCDGISWFSPLFYLGLSIYTLTHLPNCQSIFKILILGIPQNIIPGKENLLPSFSRQLISSNDSPRAMVLIFCIKTTNVYVNGIHAALVFLQKCQSPSSRVRSSRTSSVSAFSHFIKLLSFHLHPTYYAKIHVGRDEYNWKYWAPSDRSHSCHYFELNERRLCTLIRLVYCHNCVTSGTFVVYSLWQTMRFFNFLTWLRHPKQPWRTLRPYAACISSHERRAGDHSSSRISFLRLGNSVSSRIDSVRNDISHLPANSGVSVNRKLS